MQGTFQNVDWGAALAPGLDEATQRAWRAKERERVLQDIGRPAGRRRRRGSDGERASDDEAAPAPDPGAARAEPDPGAARADPGSSDDERSRAGDDPRREPPQPATQAFTREGGGRVYVIPGRIQMRPAQFGHYLRPYTVTGRQLTRPFPKPESSRNVAAVLEAGGPGVPARRTTVADWNRDRQQLAHPRGPAGDRDPYLPPDPKYSTPGEDYVLATAPDSYEIGRATLQEAVEEGERRDLAFARRMQGLLGVNLAAVWDCLDPGFNPADRQDLLSMYLTAYAQDFYSTVHFDEDTEERAVATEAIQQHGAFCQEWVHKHYKCLTPLVTAAAEALVAEFFPVFQAQMVRQLTLPQFTRLLIRDPELSLPFANALQSYMASMDALRSNRNPTYKQMTVISNTAIRTHYRMLEELSAKRELIARRFTELRDDHDVLFAPLVVDWHGIVGQLPEAHVHYRRGTENLALRFRRTAGSDAPWMAHR